MLLFCLAHESTFNLNFTREGLSFGFLKLVYTQLEIMLVH
jgi:hypothetical protein